jgi:hypothetical protein
MEDNYTLVPEPQSVAQEFTYNQNYTYAANLMVHQDKNWYEVKEALMARGVDEQQATTIIDNVESEIAEAHKAKANKDMLWGAVWCVGGIIVTAATYSAASNGGGRYFVAWGAILFGGIQFIKGVIASMK